MTPSHLFAATVDDVFMCKALACLLRANDYEVEAFAAGATFRQSVCAGSLNRNPRTAFGPLLNGLYAVSSRSAPATARVAYSR